MSKYSRSGSYWTYEEVNDLKRELVLEYTLEEIAKKHNRTTFAIKSYITLYMKDCKEYNKYLNALNISKNDIKKLQSYIQNDLDKRQIKSDYKVMRINYLRKLTAIM